MYFANPILKVNFSKFKLLLCFLPYNLFGVPYDSDLSLGVKIYLLSRNNPPLNKEVFEKV